MDMIVSSHPTRQMKMEKKRERKILYGRSNPRMKCSRKGVLALAIVTTTCIGSSSSFIIRSTSKLVNTSCRGVPYSYIHSTDPNHRYSSQTGHKDLPKSRRRRRRSDTICHFSTDPSTSSVISPDEANASGTPFLRSPLSQELLDDVPNNTPPSTSFDMGSDDDYVSLMSQSLPPWLANHFDVLDPPSSTEISQKIESLKQEMTAKSHLSSVEVDVVIEAVYQAARSCCYSSSRREERMKISGVIDFLSIMVELMNMRKDALIAAAFHYCSCMKARETELSRMKLDGDTSSIFQSRFSSLPLGLADFDSAFLLPLAGSGIERYGGLAVRIALDAARLKGTETVAASVLSTASVTDSDVSVQFPSSILCREDAKNLRSLLLAANAGGEWRSLAIRCAACLFRLRGLESYRKARLRSYSPVTQVENQVGREALYIYAPVAHRLGMHRLKSELEGVAFRVLYRRQYEAVSSLLYYRLDAPILQMNHRGVPIVRDPSPLFFANVYEPIRFAKSDSIGSGMKSVLEDIKHRVKRMLQEDETLMDHISTMSVTARIKEPYSLWRKLMRIHFKDIERGITDSSRLSVLQVPDAIALRVVLRARKLSDDEDEAVTAGRERALCYYVRQVCMDNLPSIGASEINVSKDYIEEPKPNGYQSLHFSARIRWHGEDWPFELQIRSADMHQTAEYGGAAHWDYKAALFENEKEETAVPDEYLKSLQQTVEQKDKRQGSPEIIGLSSIEFDATDRSLNDYENHLRAERIRDRAERLEPYIEALRIARMDLARERVFIFFDQAPHAGGYGPSLSGSILSLSSGARVLDAIKKEEKRSGVNLTPFWMKYGEGRVDENSNDVVILRNGALTSITDRLENGDVLSILVHSAREDGKEVVG